METLSVGHQYDIASFGNLKLNFWAIPKCGSSTIKHCLFRADDQQAFNRFKNNNKTPHWAHGQCRYLTPPEAKQNGFKNFTVLRNPIDRLYSMYNCIERMGINMQGSEDFQKDIKSFWSTRSALTLLDVIERHPDEDRNIHFRSQTSYCVLDTIIKLDLDTIESTIGQIHPSVVIDTHLNTTTTVRPPEHELIVSRVNEIFKGDVELWTSL